MNPKLLNIRQKDIILKAFEPLKVRMVDSIFSEVKKADRINFDKAVLSCFNISVNLLDDLYEMLITSVHNRVNLKEK